MNRTLRNELLEVFPYGAKERSINCDADIRRTVSASPGPYMDMGPRNLKGSGREEVQTQKEKMFDTLAKKIMNRINHPAYNQDEFDEWHEETCKWLAGELEALCPKEKNVTVKPGQAQKLINMTIKHVFCFSDADEAACNGAFQFCHMPVDQFVLSWYYREIFGVELSDGSDKLKWKHLEYKEYLEIQKEVRKYLDSEKNQDYRDENGVPLTAFETEFYIWCEEPLIRAMHRCKQELKNEHSRKWMKCSTMKNYMKEIMGTLDERGITI